MSGALLTALLLVGEDSADEVEVLTSRLTQRGFNVNVEVDTSLGEDAIAEADVVVVSSLNQQCR